MRRLERRKEALREELTDYLLRRGIADLSLRPMAAAVGTSARLLIFHFGSKEQLLSEVLDSMQERMQLSLGELLRLQRGPGGPTPLRLFWDWAMEDINFARLRLLYQLQVLAAHDQKNYGKYLEKNSHRWLETVQTVLKPSQRSPLLATLIVAVFDGLFIEVMSTGDRLRATAALDEFTFMARKHTAGPSSAKSALRGVHK
jgi:AcrR family transcriptional regulator